MRLMGEVLTPMSDWSIVLIVVLTVILFPFVVLLTAKLVGYGWSAGRHKFEQRRNKRG